MTTKFIYYSDPGIAYDISKMLYIKLNPTNTWVELFVSPESFDKDLFHIKACTSVLPTPKPEVLLFSFIPSNQNTTFLTFTISRLLEHGIHDFSISELISYLSDPILVKNDLLEFYFKTSASPKLDLDHVIRNNKTLPDKLKVLLFGFIMYPQKFTLPLINIINIYYLQIKNDLLPPLNENTDLNYFFQILTEQYKHTNPMISSQNSSLQIAYSLSYCVPEYLAVDFYSDPPFFISTELTINKYNHSHEFFPTYFQLIALCHAMSDKIRISILNSTLLQKNITIEEISEYIGLSVTATKYHVSMLINVGLLSSTRLHRKKVYSFNPDGFEKIKKLLDCMAAGELV